MSNLDAIVATVDDAVIPGLGYSLSAQQSASYVRDRHFSTFYPSGSNVYSVASGQRVLRFLISDGSKSYLDLNSVRLCFDITNTNTTDGKVLKLSGEHAACLFSRLTVRIAGVDVEDILYYNRYVGLLQNFRSVNGSRSSGVNGVLTGANTSPLSFDTIIAEPIGPSSTRTIVCELPCGLLQSHYLLPLAQFPLELVLEWFAIPRTYACRGQLMQIPPTSRSKTRRLRQTVWSSTAPWITRFQRRCCRGSRSRYPSALGVTNTSNWRTFLRIGRLGTW